MLSELFFKTVHTPIPWNARHTKAITGLTLSAIGMLKIPMKIKPRQNEGFGSKTSAIRPEMSINDANVSVYAERIHWTDPGVRFKSSLSLNRLHMNIKRVYYEKGIRPWGGRL